MANNNPLGSNQFGNFTLQPQYGDVSKLTRLTKAAPISGAPVSALNMPKRSQRQAANGGRAGAIQSAALGPTIPPQQPPPPSVAATWQAISRIPGISPLAHEYASAAIGLR